MRLYLRHLIDALGTEVMNREFNTFCTRDSLCKAGLRHTGVPYPRPQL